MILTGRFFFFFFVCQVDLLPEIALAPRVLSNYVAALSHNAIRGDLDKFLQTRHQPTHFLAELPGKLRLSAHEVRAEQCDARRLRFFYAVKRLRALLVCVLCCILFC